MQNRNHTHTGNCQACGREHAIDIVKGDVAKHGYKVDWNQFVGVCGGADRLPAQKDVSYTHTIIAFCLKNAQDLTEWADAVEAGTLDPSTCIHWDATIEWTNKYGTKRIGKNVELTFALGTQAEQNTARSTEVSTSRHHAAGNKDHAAFLTASVLPMLGTELHSVEQAEVRQAAERAVREAKPTKISFQRRIEALGRKFDKAKKEISTLLLAFERDARPANWDAAYDAMYVYSLNNWRTKHSAAVLAVLPQAAPVVAEIEALFADRAAIKTEQKAAGL